MSYPPVEEQCERVCLSLLVETSSQQVPWSVSRRAVEANSHQLLVTIKILISKNLRLHINYKKPFSLPLLLLSQVHVCLFHFLPSCLFFPFSPNTVRSSSPESEGERDTHDKYRKRERQTDMRGMEVSFTLLHFRVLIFPYRNCLSIAVNV